MLISELLLTGISGIRSGRCAAMKIEKSRPIFKLSIHLLWFLIVLFWLLACCFLLCMLTFILFSSHFDSVSLLWLLELLVVNTFDNMANKWQILLHAQCARISWQQ